MHQTAIARRPALGLQSGAWRHGYYLVGALFAVAVFLIGAPRAGTFGIDAFAYWSAAPPLYGAELGQLGAYAYSPAFYQLVAPLQTLDWTAFAWMWAALNVATAIWLGPLALAFPLTSVEVYHGNVHLLMAVAIVLGFRHPWTWSFVLLTKVTPGIGLLYFAVRREWRTLGIALGATATIVVISLLIAPSLWLEWIGYLVAQKPDPLRFGPPLWIRLPLAAAIVVWGARTDRPWVVPVAATLALPNLWVHGLAVLAGAISIASWRRVDP